ncbi:hypothetical protein PybrP1_008635 [[Pythium] brassicae (nom. inval.)]|nr:hypothetical protein PybrP1_008635 [[Pythium] brassicae (nom. inval.)]
MEEDLGAVTLLALHQVPTGKRLAYCLPTGEFLFAVAEDDAARCFRGEGGGDAGGARALYGRNLCQFLAPADIERLEDFMRGHCLLYTGGDSLFSGNVQTVVRVQGTGAAIAVQLQTIPLTLRMSRCIDAVQSLVSPTHLFADASSFVVSEEDFAVVLAAAGPSCGPCNPPLTYSSRDDADSVGYSISPGSDVGLQLFEDEDEASDDDVDALVMRKPRGGGAKSLEMSVPASYHHQGSLARRTSSTASTEIADEEEFFNGASDADAEPDASLAGFVFEADWAAEVVRESFRRSSVDWSLRAASAT